MNSSAEAERYRRLRRLFDDASVLGTDAQRAYLDEHCDASLRAEVERLLAADRDERDLYLVGATGAEHAVEELGLPERIGRYRILRRLGAGGMGSVFAAEQDHPHRTVAIKVLHAGLVTPSMLRRFEYEGEVLARLSHPSIAHVYETGAAEIGGVTLPFFAMELVIGAPITSFADERKLSLRERLELVARVADAVEHAHRTGVIHRDLKPPNILVDDAGRPKILDFGIARAADSDDRASLQRTQSGMMVGTLAYMSPEQAGGDPRALDTRSDVYALGVLAYEIVTGRLPHDLTDVTIARAARIIAEEEPTRPGAIDRSLRGDVETIVLKALEKEKERRYESAAAFASDVRAFLHDQPIAARPATTIYHAIKFTRRHKGLVLGLAATFVALVVGLVVSLAYYSKSETARIAAEHAGSAETRARRRADSINTFVLKDMLAAPDPWAPEGKDVTVAATLDRIASRIQQTFANDPELEADAHATLSGSYLARGMADRGALHAARALELRRALHVGDHADVAASLLTSARAHSDRGDLARAEDDARAALAMYERLPDTPRPALLDATRQLASIRLTRGAHAEALDGFEVVLATQRSLHGDEHPAVAQALSDLLAVHAAMGHVDESTRIGREVLALRRRLHGDDDPHVALALSDLASSLFERRDPTVDAEMAALYEESAAILLRRLGAEHRLTLLARRNLANVLVRLDRLDEAELILHDVVGALPRAMGSEHEDCVQTQNSYGYLLLSMGRFAEAEAELRAAIETSTKAFGPEHDNTLRPLSNLAFLEKQRGFARAADGTAAAEAELDLDHAEEHFRSALAGFRRVYGDTHENTGTVIFGLGDLLDRRGRDREAAEFLGESARLMKRNQPANWEQTITRIIHRQGLALMRANALAEAEPVLREAVDRCRETFPERDWRTAVCAGALGECLARLTRYDESEPLLLESFEVLEPRRKQDVSEYADAVRRLAELNDALGRPDRAREYRERQ